MSKKNPASESSNYDYRVEAQHVGVFETPIAYCRLTNSESLLTDLETEIRRQKTADAGLRRSNIGSWHSGTNMMQWGGAAAMRLAETTIGIAQRLTHFEDGTMDRYDWMVKMWANVMPAGGMNHLHAHPGNLWAAVLYLDMGDSAEEKDVGGAFYVEDPRFPMIAMRNTAVRLVSSDGKPQQYELEFNLQRGNLVVFPAWLRHGVRPYTGNRERLTVAMNIDARPTAL